MSNTYTWDFPLLETIPSLEGQENVVYVVHWNLVGATGSYSARRYGINTIAPYVSGSPFIPYAELTKPTVQGWVLDAMGAEQYGSLTSSLDTSLANRINPPTTVLPPPWE